jgi:hypothetical protein
MLALFLTVSYLSQIFWLFPAVRQFKTDLFFYFLILAVMDPIVDVARLTMGGIMYNVYVIMSFLILLIFIYINLKKIYFFAAVFISLVLVFFSFFARISYCYDLLILSQVCILLFLIKRALFFIATYKNVNIFHLVLILYETSLIMKLLALLTNAEVGQSYFLITTIFEIFIAIFFSIFKEDNKKMLLSIKSN